MALLLLPKAQTPLTILAMVLASAQVVVGGVLWVKSGPWRPDIV
jgi:hypothetical protein